MALGLAQRSGVRRNFVRGVGVKCKHLNRGHKAEGRGFDSPMVSLEIFFYWHNRSVCTVALGLAQPSCVRRNFVPGVEVQEIQLRTERTGIWGAVVP